MQNSFHFEVSLTTSSYGSEISWTLLNEKTCTTVCSSQPPGSYPSHSPITPETCNLEVYDSNSATPTTYKLHCKDTFGDGWNGGYLEIQGQIYCRDFCPDPPYCYGPGEWNPISQTGGGELYVQRGIKIRQGNILK